MPYIKQVRIQGFQSHVDSTFTLSPGLNVITGPSDAGKTAIIRALRWLAFNEPQGEAFIHTIRDTDGEIMAQAEQATVIVELSDGTVISKTRRKGKTVYQHSGYADAWEKAELPLEIKESLGLTKQQYGDNFDTYLNFAFQLDPPFLLSETGSTGAKVLGKLAGTEVVDKSIGVVVKETHQTREIIRQADKSIGQYDVELLDYLHTEDKLEVLGKLEEAYAVVQGHVQRKTELRNLGDKYYIYDRRTIEAQCTVEKLQDVPTLVAKLTAVDGMYAKAVQFKQLIKGFWDLCHLRTDLKNRLKKLSSVPELHVDLERIQRDNDRLLHLKTVTERHTSLKNDVERLQGVLGRVKPIDGLDGKIQGVKAKATKLAELQQQKERYDRRKSAVYTAEANVQYASAQVDESKTALRRTWDEAGGVCPLCNQPIKGENECTH